MDNKDIAEILQEIGEFLEIKGENTFKVRAFYNGVRIVDALSETVFSLVHAGKLRDIKGIGAGLSEIIESLVKTGKSEYYDALRKSFPAGFLEILNIPGVGPKRAKALFEKLDIKSIAELESACQKNKLMSLEGFGEKSQAKILEGIKHHNKTKGHFLISQATEAGEKFVEYLKAIKGIARLEIAGSLRRQKEIVHDIDILVSAKDPASVHEAFTTYPEVSQILAKGETKSSVVLNFGIQVDLRTVTDKEFPYALYYFTGSKEHNVAVRTIAKARGFKINEYGIFSAKRTGGSLPVRQAGASLLGGKEARLIPCKDEEGIFQALKLNYIPPELREDTGEIEAAQSGKLPRLVEAKDIKGIFHVHTTASDGVAPLEEMVRRANELGYQYIGISDHSRSAPYANGLSEERLKKQAGEIAQLQKKYKSIKIFHGIESDILNDGALDYSDKVLAGLDFVVGSVHSRFNMTEKEMTKRICCAISHPAMTFLGHPTGRLLLGRAGYDIDYEAIFDAARKFNVVIELNAHPLRLDLDWRYHKAAKAKGVRLAINPDAHNLDGFDCVRYGIGIVRKGWMEKQDILNTLTAVEVEKFLKQRKK
jgi:DNA polymerase (family 10)